MKFEADYRHALQTGTTDRHYRHAPQTRTTDTHHRHALQTRTTDTHYRHTIQTHNTDTHYRHIPFHFSHNKCFCCNFFIGVRIIKEMPGSVASGTRCTIQQTVILHKLQHCHCHRPAFTCGVITTAPKHTTGMWLGPQIMIQEPVWTELDHMLQLLHLRSSTPQTTLQHLYISPHFLPT